MRKLLFPFLLGSPFLSAPPPLSAVQQAPKDPVIRLVPIASGLDRPVALETAPGDPGRLYLVEQPGRVLVWKDGKVAPAPFLDMRGRAKARHSEQGLLGLAFHPGFTRNRRFFTYYTDSRGDSVLSEWAAKSADEADPSSERVVLTQKQPYSNHNGGQIAFGPDGKLYLGLGDGGSGGDPQNNAQDLASWLGKILRLDIDGEKPYGVPKDNPFAGKKGARPEIWAWGLRNPWRFSFDGTRLFIADVGQDKWEEVDLEDLRDGGGKNYGWRFFEGEKPHKDAAEAPKDLVSPIAAYGHHHGACSVTGGFVYRGKALPALRGAYLFGDYCSGEVWSLTETPGRGWERASVALDAPREPRISSFGRGADGELFLIDHEGIVYRLEADKP